MKLDLEPEYREKFFKLLGEMFDSNFWSDGPLTKKFEEEFSSFSKMRYSVATSSGGMALLGLLEYVGVRDSEVIVPTNTFMATPLAVTRAGGKVVFADCSRSDLCLTLSEVQRLTTDRTRAVIVVHIGGHIAFEIDRISDFCKAKGIILIEDCAHAHGAEFHGKTAGSWGIGGAYSFYATKTMPTGEGGMVVTHDPKVEEWIRIWRNYGKVVKQENGKNVIAYPVKNGFHARMPEMTAALGIVQLERMSKILSWKRALAEKYNRIFSNRVRLPQGMSSGYYKFIVFDYELKEKTGPVFGELCHWFYRDAGKFPESEWIAVHHSCPPIYFGWEHADKSVEEIAAHLGIKK